MSRALRIVRALSLSVVLALLGFLLWVTRFFTSIPQTYVGSGPSMVPTVLPGEYFTAVPLGRAPERGMLVIFRFVHEDSLYTVLRRVAAVSGDTIAMREGRAIVNGGEMDWPFRVLEPRASRSELAQVADLYTWDARVVPESTVFLLSDTRDIVGWPDSRFIGPVPLRLVEGRASRFIWSRRPGKLFRTVR